MTAWIRYAPDGKTIPSLAAGAKIAPDNKSVTGHAPQGLEFHGGTPFNARTVSATLKKATDSQKAGVSRHHVVSSRIGKSTRGHHQAELRRPAPEHPSPRDLLQFLCPIDPLRGIDTVETKPARKPEPIRGPERGEWAERIQAASRTPGLSRGGETNFRRGRFLTIFSETRAATAALQDSRTTDSYYKERRSAPCALKVRATRSFKGPDRSYRSSTSTRSEDPFRMRSSARPSTT